MMGLIGTLKSNERAAATAEYLILVAIVAVAMIGAGVGHGRWVERSFKSSTESLETSEADLLSEQGVESEPGQSDIPSGGATSTEEGQVQTETGKEKANPSCATEAHQQVTPGRGKGRISSNFLTSDQGLKHANRICLSQVLNSRAPDSAAPWGWDWDLTAQGDNRGFPEVLVGASPWEGTLTAAAHIGARPLTLGYSYSLASSVTRVAVPITIWLSFEPEASASTLSDRVQIWTMNRGLKPDGHLVASNLSLSGFLFDLYMHPNQGDPRASPSMKWPLYTFVAHADIPSETLSLGDFLTYLTQTGSLGNDLHVAGVSLGTRIEGGTGDFSISRFQLDGLYAPNMSTIGPFDFGTRTLSWDDPAEKVWSDYVDIAGLGDEPAPFDVTTSDQSTARAASNVVGASQASSGLLTQGTMLVVPAPAPGKAVLATLTIGEQSGSFKVIREDYPARPDFQLTRSDNKTFAEIDFDTLGIPRRPYSFHLSGTGNTRPRALSWSSGSETEGMTESWGITIENRRPAAKKSETITLEIDGEHLQWIVTR